MNTRMLFRSSKTSSGMPTHWYTSTLKNQVIQVDASLYALGAALIQDDQVIAYASKCLTGTEQRYANIEREMLACVFGAERFHTYVYGKSFVMQSDHKPLEMISKKSLTAAPARLQRMLLRLQRYAYSIQYRPGKEMILADSLSRLPMKSSAKKIPFDIQVSFILFKEPKLSQLREVTQQDTTLCELAKHIYNGFPQSRRDLHPSIRQYWPFRDELSKENGIILKGEQTVIPKSLQNEYLNKLHDGHQGITRCQQHAKNSIYWPGITNNIEDLVSKCHMCQKYQASQTKEPLQPIDAPMIPWHTVGTDLFTLDGHMYLIVADYYSKFPFVKKLTTYTSKTLTSTTEKLFSMFVYPNTIISDNGSQFIGRKYQEMVKQQDISHITSSPHHSKSHGFIERMVRTVKALFAKTSRHQHALLMYRTTPTGPNLPPPAEMIFGRKIPTNLPTRVKSPATEQQRESTHQRQQQTTVVQQKQ